MTGNIDTERESLREQFAGEAPLGLHSYPLLDALRDRRSRRFAKGMRTEAGPLAFASRFAPEPLTARDVAALAFAGAGISGHALGDLVYADGQGGTMMGGFVGRTVSSADAVQAVSLVISGDDGTYLLKRPEHFARSEIPELLELSRQQDFEQLYLRSRVQLSRERCAPPLPMPFNLDCNQWDLYAPGTTYFVPVNDYTYMYINGLLEFLNETMAVHIVDERAGFAPAGLGKFRRSRGGHLIDDPAAGRTLTVERIEAILHTVVTVEQGMMLQNLSLMAQALGLGAFPNFAGHEFAWFEALDFRREKRSVLSYLGAPRLVRWGAKLLGRDPGIEYPVGLERNGEVLLSSYAPPYYANMRDAVLAVVERKFGANGVFRSGIGASAFAAPSAVASSSARVSEATIEATVAYCSYLYERYGRFPANLAPFRTGVGLQAANLDHEFYERHYRPGALSPTQLSRFCRDGEPSPQPPASP